MPAIDVNAPDNSVGADAHGQVQRRHYTDKSDLMLSSVHCPSVFAFLCANAVDVWRDDLTAAALEEGSFGRVLVMRER